VLVLWVCWLVFGIDILLMLFESFFIFSSMHLTTPSFVSFLDFLVSLNKDAMIYKFGANFLVFFRDSRLFFKGIKHYIFWYFLETLGYFLKV